MSDDASGAAQVESVVPGVLAPRAVDPCGGCGQPMLTDGQGPDFSTKEAQAADPRFCHVCDSWFHTRCAHKSAWSGHCCPSCKKPLLPSVFYCDKCDAPTKVTLKSTWPTLECSSCSRPTSLAAIQQVGASEVAILVFSGAVPTAALILAFVYSQPAAVKIIAGVVAVPLALPWVANGLAAFLAGIMPAMMNASAPAAGGIQLRVSDVRDFRRMPLWNRLGRVYSFYALKAIPAMIFCVAALALIYWVTSMARSR